MELSPLLRANFSALRVLQVGMWENRGELACIKHSLY